MEYNQEEYKELTWKNVLLLHWILNPGLAINELVLGQRIPKRMLVKKERLTSFPERTYIPCPHCQTLHHSLKWSPQNHTAFGNWFGLYCDHCGGIIPCLLNLTSGLLLAFTFPLWLPFYKTMKKRWLVKQKEKFAQPLTINPIQKSGWTAAFSWAFFMYLMMEIIFPSLFEKKVPEIRNLLIGIPVWLIAGLCYGWLTDKMLRRQAK
jgi:hypothetical protein